MLNKYQQYSSTNSIEQTKISIKNEFIINSFTEK